MKTKLLLLIAGAIACATGGFLLAKRLDHASNEAWRIEYDRDRQGEVAALKLGAEEWANAVAMAEGESILNAFVVGITPAALAQRRESIELASVGLLRVSGVSGIHVFGADGTVWYSSDAKLATTGDTQLRGSWALQAAALEARPSPRPGIREYAAPIVNSGSRVAVVWLEFDIARARDAAKPASMHASTDGKPISVEAASPARESPAGND